MIDSKVERQRKKISEMESIVIGKNPLNGVSPISEETRFKTKEKALPEKPKSRRRSLFSKWFQSSSSSSKSKQDSGKSSMGDREQTESPESAISWSKRRQNRRPQARRKSQSDADSYELDLEQRLASDEFRAHVEAPTNQDQEAYFRFDDDEEEEDDRDGDDVLDSLEDSLSQDCPKSQSQASQLLSLTDSPLNWKESGLDGKPSHLMENHKAASPFIERILQSRPELVDQSSRQTTPEQESVIGPRQDLLACAEMKVIELRPRRRDMLEANRNHQRKLNEVGLRKDSAIERDLRLINWRKLAARQQVDTPYDCDKDSSSSLSFMGSLEESQSQALMITCSDDTSCSSVELIWTRREPKGTSVSVEQAPADKQTKLLEVRNIPVEIELSPSVSPSESKSADPKQPEVAYRRGLLRRFSVFELAKPRRAKEKRPAATPSGSSRSRPVSSADWVPNPIFSKENDPNNNNHNHNINESDHDNKLVTSSDEKPPEERSKKQQASQQQPVTQFMQNLDRKIKSNVSSIKSQLSEKISDTSKRASILADQLLASIKEDSRSLKDQFLLGTTNSQSDRERADRSNHSMDRSWSLMRSNRRRRGGKVGTSQSVDLDGKNQDNHQVNQEKAKQDKYSLIYLHQQQPSTGQPVVTRQPISASPFATRTSKSNMNSPNIVNKRTPEATRDRIDEKSQEQNSPEKSQPANDNPISELISKSILTNENKLTKSPACFASVTKDSIESKSQESKDVKEDTGKIPVPLVRRRRKRRTVHRSSKNWKWTTKSDMVTSSSDFADEDEDDDEDQNIKPEDCNGNISKGARKFRRVKRKLRQAQNRKRHNNKPSRSKAQNDSLAVVSDPAPTLPVSSSVNDQVTVDSNSNSSSCPFYSLEDVELQNNR